MASTIARVLDRVLDEDPDRQAVVARSGSLTYAELDRAADRAATALWSLGIRPGDRVAASLPNDLPVVTAFHGAMRIGAIWVGIGTALARPEREHLMSDCGATLLLTDDPAYDGVDPAGERWRSFAESGEAPRPDLDPHAPAGIAYTSGTTGLPKGIVHSQHNLLLPGAVLVAERGYDQTLRKGDCLPLTILNLQVLTTLLTAQAGGCCIVMDRRDPAGVVDWIRRERVSTWNGVPAQLYDLIRYCGDGGEGDPADLSSLTELWSGGGDCSDDLRNAVEKAFGLQVRGTYGLTEAPTVVSIDPIDGDWRAGSSGRPLPHLSVSVLGDDGAPVVDGEVGELTVAAATDGPWAGEWRPSLGVWGADQNSETSLRTGDLGSIDADGWLSVRDRRTALIIRGGANVYPAEVERVLMTLPGVLAAAVIGVPDERLGERVGVIIEGDADLASLRVALAELVAKYKIPEVWATVPELPRNGMGKVVRRELLDLLMANRETHV